MSDLRYLSLDDIDPSPFQQRRHFAESKLAELAESIRRDGLVEPVVVRPAGERFELIAGERRVRAGRRLPDDWLILARVVEATDQQARRMCAAENLQREDLSPLETVQAIVEILDAELWEEVPEPPTYNTLGKTPVDRVRALLNRLYAIQVQHQRLDAAKPADEAFVGKFTYKTERVFASLPRPVSWDSFRRNDLSLVTDIDEDVREVAVANKLSKSATKALQELKEETPKIFETIKQNADDDGVVMVPGSLVNDHRAPDEDRELRDVSARELRDVVAAEKANKAMHMMPLPLPTPSLPAGKYRVIYADPPWSYNNSGFTQSAAAHYETLDVDGICALTDDDGRAVPDLAASESVLFLWATSPLLPEALKVVESWGATYKACMVWDKGKAPGLGWFVRTHHELLLIATWDGNAHPSEMPVSVFRHEPGKHSAKPAEVYEMIERMYQGPYVELFSRCQRAGWVGWGKEYPKGEVA